MQADSPDVRHSTSEDAAYVAYHAARFAHLLALAQRLKPGRATRVLDIGRSRLTSLLAAAYDDVVSLGMPYETAPDFQGYLAPQDGRALRHIAFDLNTLRAGGPLPEAGTFDLIVFAEVIEHLYTAPELVLAAMRAQLAPGGLILCQTPNAAALHKRLTLLAGRNPYERIRVTYGDFGHFREYTRAELCAFGPAAGLAVVSHDYANYFGLGRPTAWHRLADAGLSALSRLVPSFSRGQTIVYRRVD
jgi:SAM-dependent methyltransferase